MRPVASALGEIIFDSAIYDAADDVLYLHVGAPEPSDGEETLEGHVMHFRAEAGAIDT